jgi:hypothetical protein
MLAPDARFCRLTFAIGGDLSRSRVSQSAFTER